MQATKRGFTLIELLVVIAIIGILSAVVLASLNTARDSANDASAKTSLSQMRAESEIWYNSNGNTYNDGTTGVCTSGEDPEVLYQAAVSASAAGECNDNASAWAAWVDLTEADFFCVDSTGFSGELATEPSTGATACS